MVRETVEVDGVIFEICLDEIGYFIKRDDKIVRGYNQRPTTEDLRKEI